MTVSIWSACSGISAMTGHATGRLRRRSEKVATVGRLVAAMTVATATLGAGQASSLSDGIYTVAQADRGERAYRDACESCHAPDLSGGKVVPGLVGRAFMDKWTGLPLGRWFELVVVSMPEANPAEVPAEGKADILAFVLQENGLPSGDIELPARTDVLDGYRFGVFEPIAH